jgi:predicted amidophosphoribosyltransferase
MSNPPRQLEDRRLERERRTIEAMLRVYCRDLHHSPDDLCANCRSLLDYATHRLDRCPFGGDKPTCAKGPIHCYGAEPREQVRQVMRYAGPKLLWRHPILTLLHFADAWRKVPPIPGRASARGAGE